MGCLKHQSTNVLLANNGHALLIRSAREILWMAAAIVGRHVRGALPQRHAQSRIGACRGAWSHLVGYRFSNGIRFDCC